jgi:hypothetical protein
MADAILKPIEDGAQSEGGYVELERGDRGGVRENKISVKM